MGMKRGKEEIKKKGRRACCVREGVTKGAWTPEEDMILVDFITQNGHGTWRNLPLLAGFFLIFLFIWCKLSKKKCILLLISTTYLIFYLVKLKVQEICLLWMFLICDWGLCGIASSHKECAYSCRNLWQISIWLSTSIMFLRYLLWVIKDGFFLSRNSPQFSSHVYWR